MVTHGDSQRLTAAGAHGPGVGPGGKRVGAGVSGFARSAECGEVRTWTGT